MNRQSKAAQSARTPRRCAAEGTGKFLILRFDPHLSIAEFEGDFEEAGAFAGAGYAEAGFGVVHGAVGLADDVLAVAGEEAVVAVVDGDRNVAADVFVNDDFALVERGEAIALDAIAAESEFHRLMAAQILQAGD